MTHKWLAMSDKWEFCPSFLVILASLSLAFNVFFYSDIISKCHFYYLSTLRYPILGTIIKNGTFHIFHPKLFIRLTNKKILISFFFHLIHFKNGHNSTYKRNLRHTNQNSFYKWTKISSHKTIIFDLKMMVKSGLELFILKFSEPLKRYLLNCQANSVFLDRIF